MKRKMSLNGCGTIVVENKFRVIKWLSRDIVESRDRVELMG